MCVAVVPSDFPELPAVIDGYPPASSVNIPLSPVSGSGNLASSIVDVPPIVTSDSSSVPTIMDPSLLTSSGWDDADAFDLFAEFIGSPPG